MKTEDFLLQLITGDPEHDSEWAIESAKIFSSAKMRIGDSYPGVSSAKDALATLRVHKLTTETNKIKTLGLDNTIRRLETIRPEARLLIYGVFMKGQSALVHVNVSAKDISMIGCVIVESRSGKGFPLDEGV